MDKELKLLQETICQGCLCGADNMKACDVAYCDKREAFNKVNNERRTSYGRQKYRSRNI